MGGKSSSSSSARTTTIQTDERVAATDNANVRTFKIEGSNNQLTDLDAIEKAGELSLAALNASAQIAMQALNQNQSAIDSLANGGEQFLSYVSDAEKDESERSLEKIVPYLLVGVSVVAIATKFGR
jgi:hypothetical protein